MDFSKIKITNAVPTIKQDFKGVLLEIARTNSNDYIKKLRILTKPYQRQMEDGTLDVELDIKLTCQALAGTVLVGWGPFVLSDGTVIEYTVENASNLLFNDPDCRKFVLDIGKAAALYESESVEAIEGKLPA